MSLRDLDALLGVSVQRLDTRTAYRAALAALTRGAASSIPPRTTRKWLQSRLVLHPPLGTEENFSKDLARLLDSPTMWTKLTKAARQRVRQSTTPKGREQLALRTARQLMAHLTTPADAIDVARAPRSINTARYLVAISFVDQLMDIPHTGIDTALVHQTRLATRSGLTRLSVARGLELAEQMGWIRLIRRMGGGGARYRLARLNTGGQERAVLYYDLIEELVDVAMGRLPQSDASYAAQLIFSVRHPHWAYGANGLNSGTWLVALADALELDPLQVFGMSKALIRRHRKAASNLGLKPSATVREILTTTGKENGALDRAAEAEKARLEAANARKQEIETAREAATYARRVLTKLKKDVGAIPLLGAPAPEIAAWAKAMHTALDGTQHAEAVQRELKKRLVAGGHDGEWAKQAVARIIPSS